MEGRGRERVEMKQGGKDAGWRYGGGGGWREAGVLGPNIAGSADYTLRAGQMTYFFFLQFSTFSPQLVAFFPTLITFFPFSMFRV